MARDFRRITAWRKADELTVMIYRETARAFPKEELYGLTAQIRRASASVPANIAEGSARRTARDFRSFLYIAQGSLAEVEYFLHLAYRLGYLKEHTYVSLEHQRAEVGRLLTGFIKSLNRQINGE